eukprot:CAMPEP_0118633290 /NCGR_PEP_ID=MMETSP0785-20121206/914_1 /TAXON_ID=91992 /ORGANISM="Bolidomonas pacifica, Strain CCMP 1866" /LENGTH=2399 /DNA_ID=CAMNT_0006524147 /DNA_START=106 /DNA_END=7305 /DNA_ORIENTATION=-
MEKNFKEVPQKETSQDSDTIQIEMGLVETPEEPKGGDGVASSPDDKGINNDERNVAYECVHGEADEWTKFRAYSTLLSTLWHRKLKFSSGSASVILFSALSNFLVVMMCLLFRMQVNDYTLIPMDLFPLATVSEYGMSSVGYLLPSYAMFNENITLGFAPCTLELDSETNEMVPTATDSVGKFMETFRAHFKEAVPSAEDPIADYKLKCFASEEAFEEWFVSNESPANYGGFVFDDKSQIEDLTKAVSYTMRGNSSGFGVMGTPFGGAHTTDHNIFNFLVTLQTSLQSYFEESLVSHRTGTNYMLGMTDIKMAPTWTYHDFENKESNFQNMTPMCLVMVMSCIVCEILQEILAEKEEKYKAAMAVAGMPDWAYWLAWYKHGFLTLAPHMGLVVVLGFLFIFTKTNLIILILFFLTSMMAFTSVVLCISAFLFSSSFGALMGTFAVFIFSIPGFLLDDDSIDVGIKYFVLLLPPCGFSYGLKTFALRELQFNPLQKTGVSLSEFFTTTGVNEVSIGAVVVVNILDSFIWMFLAWYFEKIVPDQWGKCLPPLFMFQKEYWLNTPDSSSSKDSEISAALEKLSQNAGSTTESKSKNEAVPGLEARKLRKVYGEDPVVAASVDDDVTYFCGDRYFKSEALVKSRLDMRSMVKSGYFEGFVYFVIALNMMAIIFDNERFHDNDEDILQILDLSNYVFCFVFSWEMICKMYGLSVDVYFKDPFNCFDFLLVIASYVEIIIIGGGASSAAKAGKGVKGASRGARAARLAKFARFAKMVRVLRIARLLRWFTYDETTSRVVVALKNLTLTAYKDEIMSLLGQNGAGKTTFFSMLMGIAEPTSGVCMADGKNILVSRDIVKKTVGSCPQYDILFDNYTIEEHLLFYGQLKGIHKDDIQGSVAATLKHVGLTGKKDDHVNRLSGGMRRRTSIAMACLGNPKIILLDEPSAGVDIVNRQIVWKTLVEVKKGRTIIMSTHFMEEAEILGDRVAVLKKGRLQVVGTCSELHNKFGAGYVLVVTRPISGDNLTFEDAKSEVERAKKSFIKRASNIIMPEEAEKIADDVSKNWKTYIAGENTPAFQKRVALAAQEVILAQEREENQKKCDPQKICEFLKQYCEDVEVLDYTEEQAFLEFVLPFEARSKFSEMFEKLEEVKQDFGFEQFGVSAPTLQEVFLEISDMAEDEDILMQEETSQKKGRRRSSVLQQKEKTLQKKTRRTSLQAIRGPVPGSDEKSDDAEVVNEEGGKILAKRKNSLLSSMKSLKSQTSDQDTSTEIAPEWLESANAATGRRPKKGEATTSPGVKAAVMKGGKGKSRRTSIAQALGLGNKDGKKRDDSKGKDAAKEEKRKKRADRSSTQKYRKKKEIVWSPGVPSQNITKQIKAMVVKRYIITKRNRKALLLQGLAPLFMILMGVLFTTISHEVPTGYYDEHSLSLESNYGESGLSLYVDDKINKSPFTKHSKKFLSEENFSFYNESRLREVLSSTCTGSDCGNIPAAFLLGDDVLTRDDTYANMFSVRYKGSGLGAVLASVKSSFYASNSIGNVVEISYNGTNYMSIDGLINLVMECYQKDIFDANPSLGGTTEGSKIDVSYLGMPMTKTEFDVASIPPGISFVAGILIFMSFASITASQCSDAVEERETGCKRQQLISGVNPIAYWMSNLIFDVAFYFAIPFAATIGIVEVFNVKPFSDNLRQFIDVLVCWGFASPSFAYVCSFVFAKAASCQQLMMTMNTLIAIVLMAFVLFIEYMGGESIATPIRFIGMLNPHICLGFSIWTFISTGGLESGGEEITDDGMLPVYIMIAQAVIYFVLAIAMENTQDKAAKGYAKSKVGTLDEKAADSCQPTGPNARYLRKLTDGKKFKSFIFSMIILNMVVIFVDMGADKSEDLTFVLILGMLNYLFTFVFFVEMALKLGGFGPIGYCQDPFNIFDGILVILSLVELFMAGNATFSAAKSGKVVGKSGRMLKLLRLFKFAKLLRVLRYVRFFNPQGYDVKKTGHQMLAIAREDILRDAHGGKRSSSGRRESLVKRLSILGGEYVEGSAVDLERKRISRRLSQRNSTQSMISAEDDKVGDDDDFFGPVKRKERDDAVAVNNLMKVYELHGRPAVTATNDIGFGVRQGEIFSLLGPNGAGKSTVLNMMTGSIAPTSGEVYVLDHNISTQFDAIKSRIGFCPQFDALVGYMDSYETLYMFARIKGIDEEYIPPLVESLIHCIGLGPHAHKLTFQYSGGNKRKLSVAIALLANPDMVFLDEPSTGIDPASLTDVYSCVWMWTRSGANRSIVLTTHSMEEADSLSNRIGILVNGKLAVLGSAQELKSKFGMNYTFEGIIAPGDGMRERVDTLKDLLVEYCPGATNDGSFDGRVRYELPQETLSLHKMFDLLESKRDELQMKDYTISQTTLEQVFIHFAQHQF